jgi:hypothetical protein
VTDAALRQQLATLVPTQAEAAEWEDVLRRAGVERKRDARRQLMLAVAVAALVGVAMSPVGTAIADGVGGFATWVRGEPGTPATPAEQHAFERANERTWVGFPPGTKLRRLIETELAGTTFTLYGFRSGDEFCLRFLARGEETDTLTYCAPLRVLQGPAPAVVVATDEGIGLADVPPNEDGYRPPVYGATFGIVSDGVQHVVLHGDDGTHDALLGGNAFLFVDDHPKLGARVRSAEAVAANGARAELPLQPTPFGQLGLPAPPGGRAPGPTEVERTVEGGSIEWVELDEPRGDPLPRGRIGRPFLGGPRGLHQHLLLARVIQPEPDDYLRVGVVALSPGQSLQDPRSQLCALLIDREESGGGCSRGDRPFDRAPFTFSSSSSGSSQYSVLFGLASDDVAKLVLFSLHGGTIEVPLRDNAWVVRVSRGDYPLRLVAYDRHGRVIGNDAYQSDGSTSPAPAGAKSSVRTLARVVGESGQTATLRAGKVVGGYRCISIEVSNRGGGGGCTPWPVDGPALAFVEVAATHGDVFLTGPLSPAVAAISVSYPSGDSVRVEPISSFLLHAAPHRFMPRSPFTVKLRAFDAHGRQIAERTLEVTR